MNSLFGVELPAPVNFIVAFIVVLALIGAATWLIRRFGATRLDAAARGRQPRLAVVDQAAVDGRRKLIMIRRDNVEPLLMIGGPNDVVVESAIVRGTSQPAREPSATRAVTETLPRAIPLPDATTWPLQPEPTPAPAVRVERERPRVAADEPAQWPSQPAPAVAPPAAAAPPVRAQRVDPLAGLAAELAKPAPEAPRAEPPRPKPAPAPAATPAIDPAAEKNLAEMAQRLEAALRQPQAAPAPAPQPEPKAPPKPAPETKRAEPKPASTVAAPTAAVAAAAPAGKSQLDNLEQEMANLLGRPGKT